MHPSQNGETSGAPHRYSFTDENDPSNNSDASTLIARPSAAYVSSPYVFERNPITLPGPLEELTPPPSPSTNSKGPRKQPRNGSHKSTVSLSMNFAPLTSRASSIITPPRSANPSPSRVDRPTSPWPLKDSMPVGTTSDTSQEASNRFSKTLSGLFQFQGNSAPVSLGLMPTPSPTKEGSPKNSPFGPALDSRPVSVSSAAKGSPSGVRPGRPGHARRGSTLSVAASFLGLAAPRPGSASPVRKSARARSRLDDEILHLDFENEIFPNESLGGKGEKAFDELLANAEKLFNKMHAAYAKKCEVLDEVRSSQQVEKQALEESQERFKHVKQQLNEMGAKLEERDAEIKDLEEELEERVSRGRTIRMLSPDERRAPSQSSEHVKRMWSAEGEDAFRIGEEAESGAGSDRESLFDRQSRPSSRSSVPPQTSRPASVTQQPRPVSTFWEDAAPFLPPEAALLAENKELKRRIGDLEDTLQSCLGLVDL